MVTFYLIRHGQKQSIPFDPPLTAVGVRQAEVTAELLKNTDFHEIISSPKLRTIQTAEIITKPHSLKISTDQRLIERLEWENDESLEAFIAEWNKTDLDRAYQPKKGMSSAANGEQMKALLKELFDKHTEGDVLIVTHGGTIGDLLRTLFTEEAIQHRIEPISGAKYVDILECSITKIELNEKKFNLVKLGDISHL